MENAAYPVQSRREFARLATLLSAGHLLAFVDRAKLAGAMPAIRVQVAMSETAAGWIIGTAFALGYGATILLLAVAKRNEVSAWSWRLPAGVSLWAAASLGTGLVSSVGALIAMRALVGAGQALFIPAAVSWIVAQGDVVDARASGLARFTAAASLGRSVGLFTLALALALVGWAGAATAAAWRWSFVLTALPNLVLLVLIFRLRRRSAPPASISATVGASVGWVRPAFLLLALLPIIVAQALGGWLPTLFAHDRGVDARAAATWIGVLTLIGGTGSQLVAGWLLQRLPRWRAAAPLVIAGGLVAALPGVALLGWGAGAVVASLGVLLATQAIGLASFAGLLGWQQLTPATERVAGNGLFFALVTVVGVGLGPLLTGILADHGPALREALLATAAGCAIAAALIALVAQPLYRRHLAVLAQ